MISWEDVRAWEPKDFIPIAFMIRQFPVLAAEWEEEIHTPTGSAVHQGIGPSHGKLRW